jgi:hypothetical protein
MSMESLKAQLGNLPKISQSEFRKFLPILIDPKADITLKRKWLDICIDPRLSVIVVDDSTGEEVHRVPPLIYTTQELTGRNISGTLDVIGRMADANPLLGRKYARENLTPEVVIGKPPEEDVQLWREILVRYDITKEEDAEASNVVAGLSDDPGAW